MKSKGELLLDKPLRAMSTIVLELRAARKEAEAGWNQWSKASDRVRELEAELEETAGADHG